MAQFEEALARGLSADDEEFLRDLEDGRGLFAQLGSTFQGPMRLWTMVGGVVIFAATGLGLYSVWRMLEAETTRALILWAAAGWASWTAQIALKQWVFDRMATLTILRELKKVELRVARLEKQG